MGTDRNPAQRLRLLKWVIYGLSIFAITIVETFYNLRRGSIIERIAYWLIEFAFAVLVIEIAFWKIRSVLSQMNVQLVESHSRLRSRAAVVRLGMKLAGTLDVARIQQIVSDDLRDTLGFDNVDMILDEPNERLPSPSTPPPSRTKSGVILRIGDKTLGSLVVKNIHTRALNAEDFAILVAVANQAAIAIENTRKYENLRKERTDAKQREAELIDRGRYLTRLNDITQVALGNQDSQAMLQSLADHLGSLFHADGCYIMELDETKEQVAPVAAFGPLRKIFHTIHFDPQDMALVSTVLNSGQGLVIEDPSNTPYISPRISSRLQSRSLLALPLIAGKQKYGAALLSFQIEHSFSRREINLGKYAASQIALAIAKSRALDTAQHRAQELDALQAATAALLTTLDLESLLGKILDTTMRAIPAAEKGTLHLSARDTGELQIRASQGYTDSRIRTFDLKTGESYLKKAVKERKPLLIHDTHVGLKTHPNEVIPGDQEISAKIIAPLLHEDTVLGAISLDSYHRYAFTQADLRLLVSFAATATTAIQNARLHAEVKKQAITDALTGLYNRRGLFELGQREVERAHRFGRSLSALMIDIDLFKQVNDRYGHLSLIHI
ncbi:MAG TPA: GAF domain-containing protein, partial [bacterium]|nr:GAF domain-containing protein [bacterium]